MAHNKFGLPPPAGESGESDEARIDRVSRVTRQLQEVFSAVVAQVGADEAKRLWSAVLQGQKRQRGRPRKSELSTWDVLILWLYDELKNDPKIHNATESPGNFLHEHGKDFRHSSCELIERRIRKLVKDRADGLLVPTEPPNDDDKLQRYPLASEDPPCQTRVRILPTDDTARLSGHKSRQNLIELARTGRPLIVWPTL